MEETKTILKIGFIKEEFDNFEKEYKKYEEKQDKSISDLNTFNIKLDEDPTSISLDVMYKNIAVVKGYIERTGTIYTETIKYDKEFNSILDAMESDYEKNVEFLLVNDENVRSQKSAEMRTAAANIQLLSDYNFIRTWRMKIIKSEIFLTAVRNKLEDLNKTYDALSRQLSVIQEMIKLGTLEIKKQNKIKEEDIIRLKTHNESDI